MSLYKETLMKHFRNPRFKFESLDLPIKEDGVNPSCGDNITIFAKLNSDIVEEISYTGSGCAISMASADILCEIIVGKKNPNKIITDFISMLNGDESIIFEGDYEKLEVFKELQQYPARKNCAILPWKTLQTTL